MSAKTVFFNFFKSQFKQNQTKKIALSLGAVMGGYYLQNQYYLDTKTGQVKQQLYSWGYGNFGQLGIGSEVTKFQPQEIGGLSDKKIKQISAKKMVTAILAEDGTVYAMGKNKGKILGSESINTNVCLSTQVPGLDGQKIEFITVGTLDMLAINDKGEVFTWGNASNGKLGHSYQEDTKVPSKRQINTRNYLDQGASAQKLQGLPENTKIIQGSLGNQFTVLLSDKGEVFTLGQNRKGVLGYKTPTEISAKPQKVEFFADKNVVQISSGFDFTLARTSDGKVYGWGNNDYGQLGNGSNNESLEPKLISFGNDSIKTLSCGDYFAGAVTDKGEFYTWGYGGDGQLCQKSKENVFSPQKIDFNQKVNSISCGGGHVGIITENKQNQKLYMFGRGREGQLGLGDTISSEATYRTEPKLVSFFQDYQNVTSVKCGGDHTIAIVESKL